MVLPQDSQGSQIELQAHRLPSEEGSIRHDEADLAFLDAQPGDIDLNNPKPDQRLQKFSVICIICNRMIGTGIFVTPTTVIRYTHSVGITMLLWLCGSIAAIAGTLVYIEFGLTTPRYLFGRDKISVPRNGGELHYLKDIFKRPTFFTTCLFGVIFVFIGTAAMNALSFGIRVLQAAGHDEPDNWKARGIAIVVVTFAVILHGTWRQAGIIVNNAFAIIKVFILLLFIITGFVSLGNGFKPSATATAEGYVSNSTIASNNFDTSQSFKDKSGGSYGYVESFLAIIFAFSGFNQANYVLSEIENPRKNYKWPSFFAVATVCILYLLVNISYFIVVPVERQLEDGSQVAELFIRMTYGSLSNAGKTAAPRVIAALLAISSLGNIIVMTYTAARVKQEIAKEGVLPFGRLIANSIAIPTIPFGRLLGRTSKSQPEETPIGGLGLHWIISVLLILATGAQHKPDASYVILVNLYSYSIDVFFGLLLGGGLVFLRLSSSRHWGRKSRAIPWVSTTAGAIFAVANAFPFIASWVPPSKNEPPPNKQIPWFATPTVGWCLIGAGILYWAAFYYLVPRIGDHRGKELRVHRILFFHEEHGYPVQWHERLNFSWVVKNDSAEPRHAEEEIEVRMRKENSLL